MQSFSVLHFLLLNLLQSSVAFHIEISQLLGFSTAVALLHLYIQSKYGELKKRKPLCLNMFYTMINGAKRNHQIKGLCLVFFLILSKYRVFLVNDIIYLHLFQTGKSKTQNVDIFKVVQWETKYQILHISNKMFLGTKKCKK